MPSGTSDVDEGDDLMRQHWNSLENTWEEEHEFASRATMAGIHKAGSSRVSYGDTASLKTTTEDGRIYYDNALNALHLTGPSNTTAITSPGGPVKSMNSGTKALYMSLYTTINASGTTWTSSEYQNSLGGVLYYDYQPHVFVQCSVSTNYPMFAHIIRSDTSRVNFYVAKQDNILGGAAGSFDFAPAGPVVQVMALGYISASSLS
jgi:hypothetical protein